MIANPDHGTFDTLDYVADAADEICGMLADRLATVVTPIIDAGFAQIDGALTQLVSSVTSSTDLVVVSFAGHGYEVKDDDGKPIGEAWGLSGTDQLTDVELANALVQLPNGTEVVVVSDACCGFGMRNPGHDDDRLAHWNKEEKALFRQRAITLLGLQYASLKRVFADAHRIDSLICVGAVASLVENDQNSLSAKLHDIVASAPVDPKWLYQNLKAAIEPSTSQTRVFRLDASETWLQRPALSPSLATDHPSPPHRPNSVTSAG